MAMEDDECGTVRRRQQCTNGGDVAELLGRTVAETVISTSPWRIAVGLGTPPSSPPESIDDARHRRTTSLQGSTVAVDHSLVSLVVPSYNLSTIGNRTFNVASAQPWNSLPEHVTSSPTLSTFRLRLKSQNALISSFLS